MRRRRRSRRRFAAGGQAMMNNPPGVGPAYQAPMQSMYTGPTTGAMTAAHRIQKQRGTESFVDIGIDVKAANTDCIKKAFNFYLNIADDVYRNQVDDLEL